jgi:hypothetical protein
MLSCKSERTAGYNERVICRLCGQRRGRRACPALRHDICAVCCGTKRLVEIRCPADCGYLATAREHPAAAAVRQEEQDLEVVVQLGRDLNERQSQIFFLVATFIVRYQPPELHSLVDDDVAEAAGTSAATLETSTRGVIYEHHAATVPGAHLAAVLRPVLTEAGRNGGTPFERDAAVVLRRIEEFARRRPGGDANPRSLVERLGRVIRKTGETAQPLPEGDAPPRLIVP